MRTTPTPLDRLLGWGFRRYLLGGLPFGRGFLARHFHAVRLLEPLPAAFADGGPAGRRVFFLNHPGWWDPLAAAALARFLAPDRRPFAPIDAAAMTKYPVVGRLGLFGVERDTPAGARAFLNASAAVLADPAADLWLTPQGEFAAPDARPVRFAPGLGRLVARDPDLWAVPVAVRYEFWTERLPELLLAVGDPVRRGDLGGRGEGDEPGGGGGVRRAAAGGRPGGSGACSRSLERRLEATLDALAGAAARRDPAAFRTIHAGAAGVSAGYDAVRRAAAAARGTAFAAEHRPG